MKKIVYRRKKVQDGDEKERKGGTSAKVILYIHSTLYFNFI